MRNEISFTNDSLETVKDLNRKYLIKPNPSRVIGEGQKRRMT
jgi:hypothetical protein